MMQGCRETAALLVDLNILSGNALCNRVPVTMYRICNGYG
jgi:hypothetical protein